MKKTSIIVTILLILLSCKGQVDEKINKLNKLKNNSMEYFDIEKYKDWEIDTEYISSDNNKFYKKEKRRVRIIYGEVDVQVELSDNTPYTTYKNFSLKTKSLLYVGKSFYNLNIESWKYYNEDTSLIEETNTEIPYKLSIEEIAKIVKQEFNIDIMDSSLGIKVSRNDHSLPQYFIQIPKSNTEGVYRVIAINAKNGKAISDEIIDSTKKWNKNKEIGKKVGFKYFQENNIQIHQIYDDICYTKEDWEEFIQTKSWLWRKLNT